MKIKFSWSSKVDPNDKKLIELKISEMCKDMDIEHCKGGTLLVSVGIVGPLDTELTGTIKCHCGKELTRFRGRSDASNLHLTFFD